MVNFNEIQFGKFGDMRDDHPPRSATRLGVALTALSGAADIHPGESSTHAD